MTFFNFFSESTRLKRYRLLKIHKKIQFYLANSYIKWNDFRNIVFINEVIYRGSYELLLFYFWWAHLLAWSCSSYLSTISPIDFWWFSGSVEVKGNELFKTVYWWSVELGHEQLCSLSLLFHGDFIVLFCY